jgi:hypothetical protein
MRKVGAKASSRVAPQDFMSCPSSKLGQDFCFCPVMRKGVRTMALFKKTVDDIVKYISKLSEEERAELEEKLKKPATEESAVEEVEETETADVETEDKGEGVTESEGEEIGDETATEEVTEEIPEGQEKVGEVAEETADDAVALDETESARDEMAEDNRDDIIHGLTDKVNELAEQVKSLLELKSLMEEYTQKQADNFGYKGNLLGAKKDFKDMSAAELKARQMKGI